MKWHGLSLWIAGVLACSACTDIRAFEGTWLGGRVGGDEVTRGFSMAVGADLVIDTSDLDTLSAVVTTSDGWLVDAPVSTLPEAEADVLASLSFPGAPLRVFLAFATPTDSAGDALAVIALFADDRIELRLMRAGPEPRYGVFSLRPL